ncbi:hypothetical protein WICPIJ_003016 [Wickerhamomyces pijperi]|uniref:Uncharacterized protein n=1 Tax=Wickerhamomyces pijperi TaxID=599730 RepID=A0A9P8TPM4_WICPI|nr:hypothetical protein WICPIJ_003016 [Wickerhamomyces pijperi]
MAAIDSDLFSNITDSSLTVHNPQLIILHYNKASADKASLHIHFLTSPIPQFYNSIQTFNPSQVPPYNARITIPNMSGTETDNQNGLLSLLEIDESDPVYENTRKFLLKYTNHMLKYHTGLNPFLCFEKNPKGEMHYVTEEFFKSPEGISAEENRASINNYGKFIEMISGVQESANQPGQITMEQLLRGTGVSVGGNSGASSSNSNEIEDVTSSPAVTTTKEEVFSFDLPDISVLKHAWKRHNNLVRFLELDEQPDLKQLFLTLTSFCDPLTQPMESDTHILSVALISDLVVSLNANRSSPQGCKFELALNVFQIIERCLVLLNCNDEIKLRGFNNSDLKVDWRLKLHEWTPLKFLKTQDIILLYQVVAICIYTLYSLFDTEDLCLNPFLQQLLKFWKIFTNVLLLSLEIDRRIESENKGERTPQLVKTVIRGSSSIRYVLAAMLNDDIDNRFHDLHHVNIVDFLSPFARRNGNGSLVADVRWYIGSMLALSYELNEVVEILIDLEPNDKYDEDVRYIFDYEFDDYNHEFTEEDEQEYAENGFIIYQDEEDNIHKVVRQRCTCTFPPEPEDADDDQFDDHVIEEMDDEDEDDEDDDDDRPVKAIRSDSIEFDEWGRDWRDIPRDTNVEFNTALNLDHKEIFTWEQLVPIFTEMTERPINDKTGKKIVFTIAKSIKQGDDGIIEKIYEFFQYDLNFELMINLNPELCYSMLDELFMTNGFRRVLIWFLTHLKISQSLINYIYQVLTELRGSKSKKFPFSRMGALKLSEIEKSMLLHEFFNNTIIQLNNNVNGQHGSNEKILKFICMMIKNLITKNIIDLSECKFEISNLLINYIGVIPEAKEIFFQINHKDDGKEQDHDAIIEEYKDLQKQQQQLSKSARKEYEDEEGEGDSHSKNTDALNLNSFSTLKFKKFNPALRNNLNNILNVFDNGESESLIFQPFLELIKSQPAESSTATADCTDSVEKEQHQEQEGNEEEKFVRGVILSSFKTLTEEKSHQIIEESFSETEA